MTYKRLISTYGIISYHYQHMKHAETSNVHYDLDLGEEGHCFCMWQIDLIKWQEHTYFRIHSSLTKSWVFSIHPYRKNIYSNFMCSHWPFRKQQGFCMWHSILIWLSFMITDLHYPHLTKLWVRQIHMYIYFSLYPLKRIHVNTNFICL